jgi:uncharacterized protein with von Willebrand factor type A (vWA) domain
MQPRADEGVGAAIVASVTAFADQLRATGMSVSLSAVLDAVAALGQVDLGHRSEVKTALAATLVKNASDEGPFGMAFEMWFSAPPGGDSLGRLRLDDSDSALRDHLVRAAARRLTSKDELADLARRAVERWGGVATSAGSERYNMQRVLRALDLSAVAQAALHFARPEGERRDVLEEYITRDDIEQTLSMFRRLVNDAIRVLRQDPMVECEQVGHIDFLGASNRELAAMRTVIRPLARRLATRMRRQRHQQRLGRVDMRKTIRGSLTSGGVPLEPRYRRRLRTKPELWVLCDISGSMAEFARFTFIFVAALHQELSSVRTFVFVDDVEEVSELLDRQHEPDMFAVLSRAFAGDLHRHSNYGTAMDGFARRYGPQLTRHVTLLITGDARTHHLDAGAETLAELAQRVRQLWFLNPEPRHHWDQGDSAATTLAVACKGMSEVRNLDQLAACIDQLMMKW